MHLLTEIEETKKEIYKVGQLFKADFIRFYVVEPFSLTWKFSVTY
jgi:hypothetical protein